MSEDLLTVQGLVEDASISEVVTIALLAERSPRHDDSDDAVRPMFGLGFEERDDDKAFRVSLDAVIDAAPGPIRCKMAVEYELESLSPSKVPIEVLEEFVNNVALMALLPFIRQGIADITQRVFGTPLLMPIVSRGELEFSLEREEEQTA